MRTIYLLCLIAVLLSAGACEDKNSSVKKPSDIEKKEEKPDSTPVDKAKAQNEKLKNKVGSIIESQEVLKPFLMEYGKNNPETRVRIKTSFGDIELELYKDTPLHRANFILLVKQNYFNETMMHRVSKGFVVQGGNSDGYETPKKRQRIGNYLIPNESLPKYPHVRGALSAAKYTNQNVSQASSPFEFFIVVPQKGAHHLDGKHTVFGRVTKGMDVVDEINKVEVDDNEWPKKNIYIDMELMD
jgi:peptidylprolyl isomerase